MIGTTYGNGENPRNIGIPINEDASTSRAISFEFPEYKVLLDGMGTPQRIVRKDRTIAEKINRTMYVI